MLTAVLALVASAVVTATSYNPHQIDSLPGYNDPKPLNFNQYAGQVPLPSNGQKMFYWLVESESNPSTDPIVLWLNGGPGCSSLTGFFNELGPFVVQPDLSVKRNPYAWNRKTNMVFLESPGGVGFSQSVNSTKYTDDYTTARAYEFLQEFFNLYPEYKHRDFYVTGESYAGIYIPFLVHKLVTEPIADVKLTGFAIGNPYTDAIADTGSYLDYFYSHALISEEMYEESKTICPGDSIAHCMNDGINCTEACSNLFMDALTTSNWINAKVFDEYNIYGDVCQLAEGQSSALHYNHIRATTHRGEHVPCQTDYTTRYLLQESVQNAIHIESGYTQWAWCTNDVSESYIRTSSSLPKYPVILSAGLKALIYSGDADASVNFIGTQRWITKGLKLAVQNKWKSWFGPDKQVAGFTEGYTNLTFTTIKGAGHMVPTTRPLHAIYMFECFIYGQAACDSFTYPKDPQEYLSGADLTAPSAYDNAGHPYFIWWALGFVVAIAGGIALTLFALKKEKKNQYVQLSSGDAKPAYST
ncbi:hypothetical protein LEN26_001344 [Aphanomyces euteiches]|nr:hypothetical protein AeMF1_005905 [Aphanomyces euteiches]KAH9161612.1 hypothetical protein LEN26_001344 [Aphanomyces euteiches]KAH9186113.1 hypothetical protein AeNC1_011911 [Aphanomyces euteiches]